MNTELPEETQPIEGLPVEELPAQEEAVAFAFSLEFSGSYDISPMAKAALERTGYWNDQERMKRWENNALSKIRDTLRSEGERNTDLYRGLVMEIYLGQPAARTFQVRLQGRMDVVVALVMFQLNEEKTTAKVSVMFTTPQEIQERLAARRAEAEAAMAAEKAALDEPITPGMITEMMERGEQNAASLEQQSPTIESNPDSSPESVNE